MDHFVELGLAQRREGTLDLEARYIVTECLGISNDSLWLISGIRYLVPFFSTYFINYNVKYYVIVSYCM